MANRNQKKKAKVHRPAQKSLQLNPQVVGVKMLDAIRNEASLFHPWGFYKDEDNFDLLQEDIVDSTDLSAIRKRYGENETPANVELRNEFMLITSEIAFAVNKGFKIKFTKDMLDVFTGAAYDDGYEYLESIGITKDSDSAEPCNIDTQTIMNAICVDTNIAELIKWIVENANTLKDKEGFGLTRYFIYTTDFINDYIISKKESDSGKSYHSANSSKSCPMYAVSVDGNYLTVTGSSYNAYDDRAIPNGDRIIARLNEDGTVQITSHLWDKMSGESFLQVNGTMFNMVHMMYSNCYTMMFCLSTIQELLIRETLKGIPQKEYKYTIDHIPNSVLKDNKIHYNKYEYHTSHNPYYPEHRRSPRLHVVSGFYKKNGTWVDSYIRGTDDELMSYVNDVIGRNAGENDMAKYLTPSQMAKIEPIIVQELRNAKGKDSVKAIANKYKIDQSLVRHIAKTRKTGIEEFVPSNTVIDNISNGDSTHSVNVEIEVVESIPENTNINTNKIVEYVKDGKVSDEGKIEIGIDYESGKSFKEISDKYGIEEQMVKIIVDSLSNKSRRRKRFTDQSEIDKIVDLYLNQGKSQTEIAKLFDCSQSVISRIIKEDTEMKKRAKNSTNIENHKQVVKDNISEVSEIANNNPIVNIDNHDRIFTFAGVEFDIPEITVLTNMVTVGLVSERHNMGNIPYMFEGPISNELFIDLQAQEKIINDFIDQNFTFDANGNSTKYMNLYCTGIQIILGSVVKVCIERHVNLVLKHYDDVSGEYISQPVVTMFGACDEINHPFNKLEKCGQVLLYNIDITDIICNEKFYSISLNEHEDENLKPNQTPRFKAGACTYILFGNEEDAWKLYPTFIKACQANTGNERNSVLMTEVSSDGYSFSWRGNISKGYNFK